MNNANDADITLIVGASGSGKSLRARALLASWMSQCPVLIWDWKREYGDVANIARSLSEVVTLARMLKAKTTALYPVAYQPKRDKKIEEQFNLFCSVALALGNCGVLVEELSFVTRSGWSPGKWREIITTGRAEGLRVIGTTQSPALVDKTMFTNATCICVGRLGAKSHKSVMADALDISVDELRALHDLEWVVKDRTHAVTRETIAVPGRSRDRAAGRRARSVTKPK